MFGFSFGEIVVLLIVGIVVVGPRRLPAMMRTAGSWIAKLRRMTTDLRSQSGIDDLIRQEGLEREIRELRALSRVNVIETLVQPVIGAASAGTVVSATPRIRPPEPEPEPDPAVQPLREREYPVLGCDAYGAVIDGEPDGAARLAAAPEAATTASTDTTASGATATSGATTAMTAISETVATTATAAITAATETPSMAETRAAPEGPTAGSGAAS
ncbi:Sec-independent protein translocase TatB [Sorangium cellulosum]|uniref:Sec-independent protein translocase protein TatB homolog n=1 Tax=Sorangium cellulosum TaxID=56 RepID=A0A4P2Q2E0_SORCE|nr:Sec-independent protein translocase protein TatB [Sorangium cellulosum]AUX23126.1 Sec-independent protein translocase TatB [Sorangium cellulosum]